MTARIERAIVETTGSELGTIRATAFEIPVSGPIDQEIDLPIVNGYGDVA